MIKKAETNRSDETKENSDESLVVIDDEISEKLKKLKKEEEANLSLNNTGNNSSESDSGIIRLKVGEGYLKDFVKKNKKKNLNLRFVNEVELVTTEKARSLRTGPRTILQALTEKIVASKGNLTLLEIGNSLYGLRNCSVEAALLDFLVDKFAEALSLLQNHKFPSPSTEFENNSSFESDSSEASGQWSENDFLMMQNAVCLHQSLILTYSGNSSLSGWASQLTDSQRDLVEKLFAETSKLVGGPAMRQFQILGLRRRATERRYLQWVEKFIREKKSPHKVELATNVAVDGFELDALLTVTRPRAGARAVNLEIDGPHHRLYAKRLFCSLRDAHLRNARNIFVCRFNVMEARVKDKIKKTLSIFLN